MDRVIKYHVFPFSKITKGENIIVWGAGNVGKQYIEQVLKEDYCNICHLVDSNWENIINEHYTVENPEIVREHNDNKIVIAAENKYIVNEIKVKLQEYGISNSNIVINKNIINIPIGDDYLETIINKLDIDERILLSMESLLLSNRTTEQVEFEYRRYKELYEIIRPIKPLGVEYIRIGSKHDGGYVMINDFRFDNKIAYSFGISDDVTWDQQMVDMGYDVYMYDHTINGLPYENEHFHFVKKGIADVEDHSKLVDTLDNYLLTNNHMKKEKMILKMDVEGAEYGFLNMVSSQTLNMFAQIVFEFHNITDDDYYEKCREAFLKLNNTHQVVHLHGNNWGRVKYLKDLTICDSLEITYLNKKLYNFAIKEVSNYMVDIDKPCWCKREEVLMPFE